MDVSSADSFTFYKNFTLDLNGYLLKLGDNAITGNAGKCTIVDSSEKRQENHNKHRRVCR